MGVCRAVSSLVAPAGNRPWFVTSWQRDLLCGRIGLPVESVVVRGVCRVFGCSVGMFVLPRGIK